MQDLTNAVWRKSVMSQNNGGCVEIASAGGTVGVRDSQNLEGGYLTVSADSFGEFLSGIRAGKFDQ